MSVFLLALAVYVGIGLLIGLVCIARGYTVLSSVVFGLLFITVFALPQNWLKRRRPRPPA